MVADTALGYGLWQGLNRGYDSFHQRNRDREDDARVAFEDEQARIRAEREAEAHAYGLTRRANQERQDEQQVRANDQAYKAGQIGIEQSQGTLDEWKKNSVQRAQTYKLNLDKLKNDVATSGLVYDQNKMTLQAQKSAEQYQQWDREWMSGGTVEDLVKKFNNDKDLDGKPIKYNDIQNVVGDETKGWKVTFKNGRVMNFADRNQVSIHLQSMGDKNFNQTYLLQMEQQKADLAEAVRKLGIKGADTVSSEKKTWEAMTLKQTNAFFTEGIKEGLFTLGSEGKRDIAGDVRAVVDHIGSGSTYGLVNSDVTRVANQMAKTMLLEEPAERRRKAEEFFEKERSRGVDIPKPGDDGYEDKLGRQMLEDYEKNYDAYSRAVISKFLQFDDQGNILGKDYRASIEEVPEQTDDPNAGDTITSEGLDRPTVENAAASEDVGLPLPTEETKRKLQPQPTTENKMPISQYLGNIILHMGQRGSAFSEPAPPEPKEFKLNQKAKRKLADAAEKSYNSNYQKFSEAEKVKWLQEYGKKYLPKKIYREALRKLSSKARALATNQDNGLKKKI